MTTLPAEVTFGKVVGRFLLAGADSEDPGSEPDAVPGVGTIKIVPRQPNQRVLLPEPATIATRAMICDLNADGFLVDAMENLGVWLVVGFYDITFSIKGMRILPVTVEVTAEHTALSPLDLSEAIPPVGAVLGEGQYAELSHRIETVELASEHGGLPGLADDDHTQYALADGSRGAFATVAQGVLAATASQPGHTHTASQVSDSTATGRAVMTAADAAAARTALALGTAATTASTVYATAAQGTKADTAVQSSDASVLDIVNVTQAEYDALSPPVATTLYVVTP